MKIDDITVQSDFSIAFGLLSGPLRAIKSIRMTPPALAALGFLIALGFTHVAPTMAQVNQFGEGSAVEAILRYSEPAVKEEKECKSDSIESAVQCVATREDGANIIDTGVMATATMKLVLESELTVLEDGTFIASVKGNSDDVFGIGFGSVIFSGKMKASSRTALGQEAKVLNDRLKLWKVSLNAQQLAELKSNGVVDVFVRRPFEHLKMLQPDHPPVMLTYSYKFPKPKFTYLKREGDGWVEVEPEKINDGEPFKIVTDFERPPDTTTIDLELDWDVLDGPVTITLTRSDGLFQSDVMQLVHSDKTWLMPVN